MTPEQVKERCVARRRRFLDAVTGIDLNDPASARGVVVRFARGVFAQVARCKCDDCVAVRRKITVLRRTSGMSLTEAITELARTGETPW